ncbi:MAG: fasciclin domain-containing protein [Bacteroidota bacterium]
MKTLALLKQNIKIIALAAVAVGVMALAGCNGPEIEGPTKSLIEILENTPEYSEFLTFYNANIDLLPDVSGEVEYTLFIPNNAAFDNLRTTLDLEDLTKIKSSVISSVLKFHFVSGIKDIPAGGTLNSEQGEAIHFNADGTIYDGGSNQMVEVLATIEATNGRAYGTDRILIPPTLFQTIVTHLGKVSQNILLGSDFSILARVITKADTYAAGTSGQVTPLSVLLADATKFWTVFAPTDATFYNAAGVADGDDAATIEAKVQGLIDSFSGAECYGIVANHVVTDDGNASDDNTLVDDAELVTGATFPTAFTTNGVDFGSLLVFNNTDAIPADNGIGVYLDSDGDVDLGNAATLANLDAEIVYSPTVTGLNAANGSIYIIAGVLVP